MINSSRSSCLKYLSLILCMWCTSQLAHAAYVPPIGIPAPPFGIDQTVQSTYGQSSYYTYYIDNRHPSSTDSGNPRGTPTTPRKTIPATLVAGDVVQIHGGPYTPPGDRFFFRGQGTVDQPIFITGANSATKPIFTKKVHITSAKYLIFENIEVRAPEEGISMRPLVSADKISYVSIRNSVIAGSRNFKSYNSFAAHSSFGSSPITYIVFYNNENYDAGVHDSPQEDDTASFSIQHNVQHAWVVDNTGYRSGGDGIILAHGANFSTHHIYIGRNIFYEHRENGIDLKMANDVIVSENIIYNHRPTNSSSGEAIVIHYDPTRIWILNNLIYNCENGIVNTGSSDSYIMGNIINNIHHTPGSQYNAGSSYSFGAAIHSRNSQDIHIVNNTIYNYDAGIQVPNTGPVHIYNNILANRTEEDSYDVYYLSNSNLRAQFDNNIFHPIIGEARIGWGSSLARSLAGILMNFYPMGSNSYAHNTPGFANPTINNFNLPAKSQAVNKGRSHDIFAYFNQLYGLDIAKDINGNNRISGTSIDIGATEVQAIAAPSNLQGTLQ